MALRVIVIFFKPRSGPLSCASKRLLLPSVGQARSALYKKMCERAHYQLARGRHGHLHDKLGRLLGGGGAAAAHGAAARTREFDGAVVLRAPPPPIARLSAGCGCADLASLTLS